MTERPWKAQNSLADIAPARSEAMSLVPADRVATAPEFALR